MKNKKILIISGTHGNEYAAVEVGMQLKKYYLDCADVTVTPWLNETGLYDNSREVTSKTTQDLNRSFHEEYEFGITHSQVKTRLLSLIEQHDIVIDIHNSWNCSNFFLVDMGHNNDIITSYLRSAGTTYASRYSGGGTIKDYVNNVAKKIGFTYEFSGMDNLNAQEEKQIAFEDITELVQVLQEDNNIQDHNPQQLKELHCLKSGFVKKYVKINESCSKDEPVFEILDQNFKVQEIVYAPCDMRIIAYGTQFQKRGSAVAHYIEEN